MKAFLLWAPRALAVLFILVLALFAMDVFSMGADFWATLGGFFIHLIPSLILLVILVLSWRDALLGGLLFIITGTLFTIRFGTWQNWGLFAIISIPPVLIGLLFVAQWLYIKSKKQVVP